MHKLFANLAESSIFYSYVFLDRNKFVIDFQYQTYRNGDHSLELEVLNEILDINRFCDKI